MTDRAALSYDFNLARKSVTGDDVLVISGIASNWDLDRDGDKMNIKAFDRSLKRYMSTNPIVLYAHRYSMPMGKTTKAEVKADGLHVTVELPRPEPGTEAMNIWRLVKAGVIRAFSVGGHASREVVHGISTILDWDWRELSIAAVGVNPGTTFSLASAQVGKAFGDPVSAVDRARAELATLRDTSELLDRIGIRLDVMAVRERCRS